LHERYDNVTLPEQPRTEPAVGPAEPKEATNVPMIEVKLYDRRVTEEAVPKMIEALTTALAESSGAAPEHIQVVIQGIAPSHWGIGGRQQS
jgi:4-oxalocrotonate tautomerase family enzyme